MPRRISPDALLSEFGTTRFPRVVDVRREEAARLSGIRVAGSVWRPHRDVARWLAEERRDGPVVVYCAHGHNVSEIAAAELAGLGVDVRVLEGGLDGWLSAGGPKVNLISGDVDLMEGATIWITRERPKVDRIACPWLVRRFIDPDASFRFVGSDWVVDVATEIGGIAIDVEGVRYTHRAERCRFDALVDDFGLGDTALSHMAAIIRGADTARFDLAPEAPGLAAISFGLSAFEDDDLRQLEFGMTIYDALYAWCRHAMTETHSWKAA